MHVFSDFLMQFCSKHLRQHAKHITYFTKWILRTGFSSWGGSSWYKRLFHILNLSTWVMVFTIIQHSSKAHPQILLFMTSAISCSYWLLSFYVDVDYNHCIFGITLQWFLSHLSSHLQDTIIRITSRTCFSFTKLFTSLCFLFWLLFYPQFPLLLQQLGSRR